MDNVINIKAEKLSNPYKITTTSNSTKDVDETKRTVSGMFNSYYYIDSDMDMLVSGAASKSIQERGVGSTKGNKIKHLKDHDWSKVTADLTLLEEGEAFINDKNVTGILHNSFYPTATDSNDMLIKVSSGLYDARSIGFKYVNLVLAERDSDNKDSAKAWEEFLPQALNPEVAEDAGFFWVVKEIMLWEGSDVAFGANELTPFLGMKSKNSKDIEKDLFGKLDIMNGLFRKGNLSDEGFHRLEMESNQIKAYISALANVEPSIKDTILKDSRTKIDTQKLREKTIKNILM